MHRLRLHVLRYCAHATHRIHTADTSSRWMVFPDEWEGLSGQHYVQVYLQLESQGRILEKTLYFMLAPLRSCLHSRNQAFNDSSPSSQDSSKSAVRSITVSALSSGISYALSGGGCVLSILLAQRAAPIVLVILKRRPITGMRFRARHTAPKL